MSFETELINAGVVAIAALLGAVVGFERKSRNKSAGVRTHSFIAASTALLTSLGTYLVATFNYPDGSAISSDPTRILHSIMIGVSFIGGGMIFHKTSSGDKDVKNLTTAASILLTALMGAAVGLRLFYLSVAIVILIIFINVAMRAIENYFFAGEHEIE